MRLRDISLKVMWEKQRTDTLLPPPQIKEAECDPALLTRGPIPDPPRKDRASSSAMTPADSLSPIWRLAVGCLW